MADRLGDAFVELSVRMTTYRKRMASAQAILKRTSALFAKAGKRIARSAKRFTLAGAAAVAGVAVASVKAFSDFDSAMTQSLAIMGDVSDAMRTDMVNAAREMSTKTTFASKELASAYFFLASAGLDAAKSIKALPAVAKFAQAGMFDLSTATDLLTDAQSALGLASKDATRNMMNMSRVSDVLVKANTLANASVLQFSASLTNRAAPALRALGKDVEEGVAVLAALADQGRKGSEAGMALSIVFRDLQRAAIENKQEFKRFGVEVFDTSGEMVNIADIIGDLEKALVGASDEQKKMTLSMMGFQERAVMNIVTLLGTSDKIREYEKELRKAGGTTDLVAQKQLKAFSAQMKILQNRLVIVAQKIGKVLSPAVLKIGKAVVDVAERFGMWLERMRETGAIDRWTKKAMILVNVLRNMGKEIATEGLAAGAWGDLGRILKAMFMDAVEASSKVFMRFAPGIGRAIGKGFAELMPEIIRQPMLERLKAAEEMAKRLSLLEERAEAARAERIRLGLEERKDISRTAKLLDELIAKYKAIGDEEEKTADRIVKAERTITKAVVESEKIKRAERFRSAGAFLAFTEKFKKAQEAVFKAVTIPTIPKLAKVPVVPIARATVIPAAPEPPIPRAPIAPVAPITRPAVPAPAPPGIIPTARLGVDKVLIENRKQTKLLGKVVANTDLDRPIFK